MWKLWDNWNKVAHGEDELHAGDVVSWCLDYLRNFQHNQIRFVPVTERIHPAVWKPPEDGVVKINYDVAFPVGMNYYVMANVARDSHGSCVWWSVKKAHGRPKVVDGEAHAALYAITSAKTKGCSSIVLEGDNLQVVTALRENKSPEASFGALLEECLTLSREFTLCNFVFVKRSGNLLAHAIAKNYGFDCNEGVVLPSFLAHIA